VGSLVLPTFPAILENFDFLLREFKHIVLSSVMKRQASYILIFFTT